MVAKRDKPGDKDKELSEIEKLKLMGVNPDKLISEIVAGIESNFTSKIDNVKTGLSDQLLKLAGELDGIMQSKIDTAIKSFDIPAIIQQVTSQVEGTAVTTTGGNNAGGNNVGATLSIASLLKPEVIDGFIKVVAAWRQPSSNESLMDIFRTLITGMKLGLNIKSGNFSPDEMEKSLGIVTGQNK